VLTAGGADEALAVLSSSSPKSSRRSSLSSSSAAAARPLAFVVFALGPDASATVSSTVMTNLPAMFSVGEKEQKQERKQEIQCSIVKVVTEAVSVLL
jgi:hypothetical protein